MDEERKVVLYENTTNFAKREVREYYRFAMLPNFIKLSVALPLLFLAAGVYMFVIGHQLVFYISAAICVALVVIMPFVYKAVVNNATKQNKLLSGNTFIDYKFEEEGVRTTTRKGSVIIATFAIDYKMVNKITETDNFVYFNLSGNMAYILDKNGMTYGKLEDFINFLKSRGITYVTRIKSGKKK